MHSFRIPSSHPRPVPFGTCVFHVSEKVFAARTLSARWRPMLELLAYLSFWPTGFAPVMDADMAAPPGDQCFALVPIWLFSRTHDPCRTARYAWLFGTQSPWRFCIRHHAVGAVQLAATARWSQCVHCSFQLYHFYIKHTVLRLLCQPLALVNIVKT